MSQYQDRKADAHIDEGHSYWLVTHEVLPLKKEVDMERINPYTFYEIGAEFQPLKADHTDDVPAGSLYVPLLLSRWRLERLLQGDPVEIALSRQDATIVHTHIARLVHNISPQQSKDGQPVPAEWSEIPSWELSILKGEITKFENVFSAEMENSATYKVPRRGLYSIPALVNEAETTFPPEIHGLIPNKALEDFSRGRPMFGI